MRLKPVKQRRRSCATWSSRAPGQRGWVTRPVQLKPGSANAATPVTRHGAARARGAQVQRAVLRRRQVGADRQQLRLVVPIPGLPRHETTHVPMTRGFVVGGSMTAGWTVAATDLPALGA